MTSPLEKLNEGFDWHEVWPGLITVTIEDLGTQQMENVDESIGEVVATAAAWLGKPIIVQDSNTPPFELISCDRTTLTISVRLLKTSS